MFSMARLNNLVELLNTPQSSSVDNIVIVDKTTLTHIQNCVQDSKDTLDFIQLKLKLLQEETHSELVHVQKNPLDDSVQQPTQNDATSKAHIQTNGPIIDEKESEDEVMDRKFPLVLLKPNIKPW